MAEACEQTLQRYYDLIKIDMQKLDQYNKAKKEWDTKTKYIIQNKINALHSEWSECNFKNCCHDKYTPQECVAQGKPLNMIPGCGACYAQKIFSKMEELKRQLNNAPKPPLLPSTQLPPIICNVMNCSNTLNMGNDLTANLENVQQLTVCIGAQTNPGQEDIINDIELLAALRKKRQRNFQLFMLIVVILAVAAITILLIL
jgi:predicted nucleic acid-binding Zn ribbon protein